MRYDDDVYLIDDVWCRIRAVKCEFVSHSHILSHIFTQQRPCIVLKTIFSNNDYLWSMYAMIIIIPSSSSSSSSVKSSSFINSHYPSLNSSHTIITIILICITSTVTFNHISALNSAHTIIIITSLKWGILVTAVLLSPSAKQWGHGLGIVMTREIL